MRGFGKTYIHNIHITNSAACLQKMTYSSDWDKQKVCKMFQFVTFIEVQDFFQLKLTDYAINVCDIKCLVIH